MGKYNEKLNYIYCLIIISISIFIISKTEIISRYFLLGIKNEFIPQQEEMERPFDEIIYEVFPMLVINKENVNKDINYDKYTGFAEINNYSQTIDSFIATNLDADNAETATPTDSTELVEASTLPVNQGIVYSMDELNDYNFLLSNCYVVDSSTSLPPEELNAQNLLSMDMGIDLTGDDYKVLVYHTHGSEAFADSREGVTEDTVIGVGDELTRILEEDYGIKTYHDRTVYDIVDGELDRSYAYDQADLGIEKILEENPSIEVVLDIHRDGVNEEVRLVRDIDGKPTAQIMFLNGVSRLNLNGDIDYLYNPNKLENLSFSLKMHLAGKKMYGDLMRPIFIRGYCFNLDVVPRASLVEVGAQTNTLQEAKNAMIPLAAIVYSVLSE